MKRNIRKCLRKKINNDKQKIKKKNLDDEFAKSTQLKIFVKNNKYFCYD